MGEWDDGRREKGEGRGGVVPGMVDWVTGGGLW